MRPNYKPKLTNRPRHILQNDCYCFLTVRTVDGQWFLRPDKYKEILLEVIHDKSKKFGLPLIAYAILQNHYHLMIQVGHPSLPVDQTLVGKDQAKAWTTIEKESVSKIPKFIRELNGASARYINKADNAIDRKIWWNYYDHVIRDEADFFKHLNYINQNPIKHGLTKDFDYKFSSYDAWLAKRGKEYLDHAFEKYPIVDFMKGDEF